jgi:hypothetical protein
MTATGAPDMLRAVFDALPSLIFIVDEDVRIQEYNAAAAEILLAGRMTVLKQRAGEVLHCLHSTAVAAGCGQAPFCERCIIRGSVKEVFQGKRVVRQRARLELSKNGVRSEMYAMITVSPFLFQERAHALLVIEDISELAEFLRTIPVCSVCRKVRDDRQSWMRFEAYFKNHWSVEFSHGLCPDCYAVENDKIQKYINGEKQAAAAADQGVRQKLRE